VGADGVAGFGAACAEALDGPAGLFAVDAGEEAGGFGGDGAGGGGLVVGGGVGFAFEEGDVSTLGLNDLEEGLEGCAGAEGVVRERCAGLWCVGVAGEVEHPAGEDVGELDEVAGHGVAVLLHDVDALPDLDPVAGEAAEGLVHGGEEGDGAGACGFAGLDHEFGKEFGLLVGGHEGTGAGFDVEDEGVEAFGELFAHDTGADEVGGLDGAGVVAEGVEDAVGGDEAWGLADEGRTALAEDFGEALEGELGVEAGDGFELVQSAAGVAEAAAGDHGDADAGDSAGCGGGQAVGCKDRGDEEGGLVADAAGGVLVDGEGLERAGVEGFAGEAHGGGEGGELVGIEAALEDGHEEGGDLGVGDELVFRGAVDDGVDELLDFGVGEDVAVSFVEDDVDGVDGLGDFCWGGHGLGLGYESVRRKAAGRSSAMVAWAKAPFSAGKKMMVSGVLNSWMVWRQAPQGWLAVELRLATAMARMRRMGPWTLTAVAMAACSAQTVRR
jgi:hypothetical protein